MCMCDECVWVMRMDAHTYTHTHTHPLGFRVRVNPHTHTQCVSVSVCVNVQTTTLISNISFICSLRSASTHPFGDLNKPENLNRTLEFAVTAIVKYVCACECIYVQCMRACVCVCIYFECVHVCVHVHNDNN